MTVPESLNGLVMAGGKSRRMGSDKAALLSAGETQLQRAERKTPLDCAQETRPREHGE